MTFKLPPYPIEYLSITYTDKNDDIKEIIEMQNEQVLPFAITEIFLATIASTKQLTTDSAHIKEVTEICLNIKNDHHHFEPGDTIGILPQNSINEVNEIIDRLRYNNVADKIYNLSVKEINTKKKFKIPPHIPSVSSIKNVLLNSLDIRSVPKKTFLRALSKYTTNVEELNILNELCSQEGSTKYMNFISNEFMPLLELLKKFPSCFPPFPVLLEHLPRLNPRPFSISCSPLSSKPSCSNIRIIYSLTILPKLYEGVCTSWLKKKAKEYLLQKNAIVKIPIYFRKPTIFRLSDNPNLDIILISSGTGFSPFLGFLEHRAKLLQLNNDISFGYTVLFYGCRYSNLDFLYKNEIEHFLNIGILNKLFTSFSRGNLETKYVQDNIEKNAKQFVELINGRAIIYVCGNKNMTNAVFDTTIDCIKKINQISHEEASEFVKQLKNDNKYIQDVWE